MKVNPIAPWTDEDIAGYKRDHDLLEHPLASQGYPSIGCWPCTRSVHEGDNPRAGRWAALAVAAVIVLLAGFGGGYLVGHSKSKPAEFAARRVIAMHGQQALAVIRLAKRDSVGNWPMQFEVTGLPTQHNPRAYYELWATRDGKAVAPCGSFRVHGKTTRVRFSVPYEFHRFDGWVVTVQPAGMHEPGRVVLTT